MAGVGDGLRRGVDGVRLAVTVLTVAPLRVGGTALDRVTAGVAMSVAPAVGAVLGCVLAAVGLAVHAAGATALVAASVMVSAGVLLTRGLHIDGLADTVDALGSYADAERALAIMRRPEIGPFGVAAIVLVLLTQVAAAAEVLQRPWPAALAGVVTATAAGRLAITMTCRRGVPAARSDGLGALVAESVATPAIVVGGVIVTAIAIAAVPGQAWQGPFAVIAALGVGAALVRHAVRRIGGVTGDVLGGCAEFTTTVTYLIISI